MMTTRIRFTIVELLIIIAIIVALMALLLPAMESTIDTARKTKCAGNLRMLCATAITYFDDYRSLIPSINVAGTSNGSVSGNTAIYAWYRDYLVAPSCPETAYADNVGMAMRFYTMQEMICPARDNIPLANSVDAAFGRKYNFSRQTYGLFTYVPSDRPISTERVMKIFALNRGKTIGSSPALWADRCNLKDSGSNGGFVETDHKLSWIDESSNEGIPQGGNIGSLEGRVKWGDYLGMSKAEDAYIINGGAIGGHMGVPSNVMMPSLTTNGVLLTTPASGGYPRWVVGSTVMAY